MAGSEKNEFSLKKAISETICFLTCVYRVSYAGDNFVRYTGDTISMAQTQCKCFSVKVFYIHSKEIWWHF